MEATDKADASNVEATDGQQSIEATAPEQSPEAVAAAAKHGNENKRKEWPEDMTGFWWPHRLYLRWTYSYLSPLLAKGSRQHKDGARLDHDDLFDVPIFMKSRNLSIQFREIFYSPVGNQKLFPTLWNMIKVIYIPSSICQLITVLCQSTNPLIVRGLLSVLEDNPSQQVTSEGLPFAFALFLVLLLNGLANHRHRHLAMKSGVLMRTALVNVIYEHVLHLTPRGRANLTSGEVSTLVAVDTQKVFEAAQEGNLVWSLPLSIILVTSFLLIIMGPVTLVGICVLISFLPIGTFVTAKMLAIRKKRVKKTDERIEIVSSMLQGIKIAKLNNYEENYKEKIVEARNLELKLLSQEMAIWALSLTITVLSPLLATAATFSVYVLVDEDNILTAAKTFSVLILFAALRFPINYAARFMGKAAQAMSAMERIAAFLKREAKYEDDEQQKKLQKKLSDDDQVDDVSAPLVLQKAAFRQGFVSESMDGDDESNKPSSSASTFHVSEFNLTVKKGEVVAICGPVASGKSTLVGGIIHEVEPATEESKVVLNGSVAYVPQTPFIINTTVRENILFGLPLNRERYEKVLDSCCLRADVEQLGAAQDLTEIGERGVTLSGGQKQRVALARAAYAAPDVVLLDDPLSALDSGTSKLVFERLIKGRNALFADCAVVLVTHASHFLNLVDQILIVVDGHNKFYGNWNELASFHPLDESTARAINHIRSSIQEDADKDAREEDPDDPEKSRTSESTRTHKIMTVEEREYGLSSLRTWLLWFDYAGGAWFLLIMFVFLACDRFFYVAVEYWIARWTDGADEPIEALGRTFAPQTDGFSAQYDYLRVFSTVVAISVLFTNLRSEWVVTGGSRAAKKVHDAMLVSVLKAPMSYFETTPLGRVLNRFTYDIEVVDIVLTESMSILMIAVSWFCAGVAVMSSILPWMLLALLPVVIIYLVVLLHYRKSGVDLQRLDAMSRSPVQAMVSEVLDGCSTIRIFERQSIFVDRFRAAADVNSSAMLSLITAQRWLGVRIESLGSLISLVATILVVCLNDVLSLEPGIVGLLIIWSSNFTITLGFLLDFFGEAENAITAIERVDAMTTIPSEKSMKTDESIVVEQQWPHAGQLEFDNVCLRYRDGLPLALDNLNFTVPAGKTCGVVGRTGAGKSSLTVALFRLVEIESGRILLDGVELGSLGLADVRGRSNGMTIIPQDPFLTGSTLRECIDPFKESPDEDVLEALVAVRMARAEEPIEKLNTRVEEGGSNYSVGERQLLNLARALLSMPTVLVLDEATASVDGATDAFIQEMIRTRFKDTTLLTVAHRLNTIMDYDMVVVMADGKAAEIGSPAELLKAGGKLAELVDATGPESAKALRQLAMSKQTRQEN
eukprot:CAMPEP_0172447702 /NCGR_PEP_ID=MMETSP1065-20121228/6951_1 /TAXON_ID=265537 /ORGANISM="Amphiprora paludosa, Strain CCMP125" /LENGTH=1365 /DNA_ID=CAMNT_0013199065 /DNA_START=11 /DNA_END=4108 /DNA_ORIENTATION=+